MPGALVRLSHVAASFMFGTRRACSCHPRRTIKDAEQVKGVHYRSKNVTRTQKQKEKDVTTDVPYVGINVLCIYSRARLELPWVIRVFVVT